MPLADDELARQERLKKVTAALSPGGALDQTRLDVDIAPRQDSRMCFPDLGAELSERFGVEDDLEKLQSEHDKLAVDTGEYALNGINAEIARVTVGRMARGKLPGPRSIAKALSEYVKKVDANAARMQAKVGALLKARYERNRLRSEAAKRAAQARQTRLAERSRRDKAEAEARKKAADAAAKRSGSQGPISNGLP